MHVDGRSPTLDVRTCEIEIHVSMVRGFQYEHRCEEC